MKHLSVLGLLVSVSKIEKLTSCVHWGEHQFTLKFVLVTKSHLEFTRPSPRAFNWYQCNMPS